jgi:hypothetical protein
MPFNCLLFTCLINETSFTDCGVVVRVTPLKNEKVMFFSIDDMSNNKSTFRNDIDLKDSICDLIIYQQGVDRKTFCFVELKGTDISHAIKQILNTKQRIMQAFNKSLRDKKCKNEYENIIWKAIITIHTSSPIRTKEFANKVKKMEDGFGQVTGR